MAGPRAGPQGIGASSKRQRAEITASKKKKKHHQEKDEQETVILPDDVEEDDIFGQLNALFKALIAELDSVGGPESDSLVDFPLSSPRLLNGLIHECDQILRSRDQKQQQSNDNDTIEKGQEELPVSFYNVYGSSLLFYSRYRDAKEQHKKKSASSSSKPGETPYDYAQAALERVDSGLSTFPESQELLLLKAKCLAVKAATLKKSSSSIDSLRAAEEAWNIIRPLSNSSALFPIYSLLYSSLSNINLLLKSDDSSDKRNTESIDRKGVETLYKEIQDRCRQLAESKDPLKPAARFMAEIEMSLAQPSIDVVEEYAAKSDNEDQDDSSKPVIDARDNAVPHLEKTISYLSKLLPTENIDLMQQLAEAYMTLGGLYNLDGNVKQEKENYSRAIDLLEKIQSSGGPDMTEVIEGLREDDD